MSEHPSPATSVLDLRCSQPDCHLYELRLEPDEVMPTPDDQPDCCAACRRPLEAYPVRPK
jgi:hypothetical protein